MKLSDEFDICLILTDIDIEYQFDWKQNYTIHFFLYLTLFFSCCKCPLFTGTRSIISFPWSFIKPLKTLSFSDKFLTEFFTSLFEDPFNAAYSLAQIPIDLCRNSWHMLTWRLADPSVIITDNCHSFFYKVESFSPFLICILKQKWSPRPIFSKQPFI